MTQPPGDQGTPRARTAISRSREWSQPDFQATRNGLPRRFTQWDLLGILTLTGLSSSVGSFLMLGAYPGYPWLKSSTATAALIGVLSTVALSTALARKQGLRPRGIVLLLTRVWAQPPRDWVMFVFGVLVALPLLALHTRLILGDSDSARVLASVVYVQGHGPEYLIQTQESLLPHLLLGPFIAVDGIAAAKLFAVLSVQALAGVTSFISFKLTRLAGAALASVLALLSFETITERAGLLPMYSTMLALGFLGVFLSHRAICSRGRPRWIFGVLSGLCIVLSSEAHALGQLFFLVPLFLLVTDELRATISGLLRVYAGIVVFFLPRAVINMSDGGFTRFLGTRVDYWITKGYLVLIQRDFWNLERELPLDDYISSLPEGLLNLLAPPGMVVVALAGAAALLCRGRLRYFAVLCFAFFTALTIYQQLPPFPRYFSQLMVGATLAAGGAVAIVLRRGSGSFKPLALVCIVALLGTSLFTIEQLGDQAQEKQDRIASGPLPYLAGRIDDGKAVIGARAGQLMFVTDRIQTYGGQFLSEEEYVTYLTWPSDDEVLEMMRARSIGWILITPGRRFEGRYHNTWLVPTYDKRARHFRQVKVSPNFCKVPELQGYELYKLESGDLC